MIYVSENSIFKLLDINSLYLFKQDYLLYKFLINIGFIHRLHYYNENHLDKYIIIDYDHLIIDTKIKNSIIQNFI